jgi:hypothetical protein
VFRDEPTPVPASGPIPVAVGNPDVATGAGALLVLLALSTVLGGLVGGAAGAGASYALVGGVRSAYRSAKLWNSPDATARREAGETGVMAVLSLGIAGSLTYHLWTQHGRASRLRQNRSD